MTDSVASKFATNKTARGNKGAKAAEASAPASAPAAAPAAVPEAAAAAKAVQMFYTRTDSKGVPVSLWLTVKTKDNSPDLDGTIGDRRVAGYIQHGSKGSFLSLIDSKLGKGENGRYTQVGRANLVLNAAGIPKLAISLEGVEGTVWAETSLRANQNVLVSMGLNLEAQATKKAEAAARRAETAAA